MGEPEAAAGRAESLLMSLDAAGETLLKRHPIFNGLPTSQIRTIAGMTTSIHFLPEAIIFRAGDPADTLYLINGGRVTLETYEPGTGAITMESLGPGDILGLSWVATPNRWRLDARAIDRVEALAVDAARLRTAMDADHDLGYWIALRMVREVMGRLDHARRRPVPRR